MKAAVVLLLACLAACARSAKVPCSTLDTFFASNPQYAAIADALPELTAPDAAVTLLLPVMPSNSSLASSSQAVKATPELLAKLGSALSNLVIPTAFPQVADLLDAGVVLSAANSSVVFAAGDDGSVTVALPDVADVKAALVPVAFPAGGSVVYLFELPVDGHPELPGLQLAASDYPRGSPEWCFFNLYMIFIPPLNLYWALSCR